MHLKKKIFYLFSILPKSMKEKRVKTQQQEKNKNSYIVVYNQIISQ